MKNSLLLNQLKACTCAVVACLTLELSSAYSAMAADVALDASVTKPTVRVVGIAAPPFNDTSWWSADGVKLAHTPLTVALNTLGIGPWQLTAGQQDRLLVLEITGAADQDANIAIPGIMQSSSTTVGSDLFVQHVLLPASVTSCTIRVGLASAPWFDAAETVGTNTMSMGSSMPGPNGGKSICVLFSQMSLFGDAPGITVSTKLDPDDETRIVFVDGSGKEVDTDDLGTVGSGDILQRTVKCSKLTIGAVKSIKFQERPYDWTDLNNVPLTPPAP